MSIDSSKTYDYKLCDASIQEWWQSAGVYLCEKASVHVPVYTVDTPPPTISGSLHIGHIFSYTQTDIIARFMRHSGNAVFYPFGFDDNGLPTERFVEKKHGVSGYSMGRAQFVELCSKESGLVAQEFESLWKKLGISADWSRTYSTISPEVQKIAQASFIDLYNKKYVYRKEEPALYCTTCFTSVAQAELDDQEQASVFYDIIFTAEDGSPLIIATTRPELLGSCVALFYNPEDARYKHLAKTNALVPVFEYKVPIMADSLVDITKGTGLVMCCTFGDKNDIAWFKKYNLPYRASIESDGRWSVLTGQLAGLKVMPAREKMVNLLKQSNTLSNQRAITHAVNVHERCKKSIEYIILKQWFLNLLDHKQAFLKQAEEIEWFPSYMHTRYRDWVEHLQWDWCLSRQRFYGIPFPVWYCMQCKHIKVPAIKSLPIDPQAMQPETPCDACGSTQFTPDTDVMDTWNTSSLTPYICADLYEGGIENIFGRNKPPFLPMSMRPQAHDIIRTWAFYTIIKTWMHHKTIPWKSIVISGHVLSSERDKISKSRGNSPMDPENLLNTYSADTIRYWTASGALGTDISFSESQIKIGSRLQTKIWNAFRFIKEHCVNVSTEKPVAFDTLNQWILHSVTESFERYGVALKSNEFGTALHAFEAFFWSDLCDNYLELIKDMLFNPHLYDQQMVETTRWTLAHVGLRTLQMLAPYMPHITEYIYKDMYAKNEKQSIHKTLFSDVQIHFSFAQKAYAMKNIIALIGAMRKLKSEQQLSLKTPLVELFIHAENESLRVIVQEQQQIFASISHAQKIIISADPLMISHIQMHSDSSDTEKKWSMALNADELQVKS